MNWEISDLKAKLKSQTEILGWVLNEENTHRFERYFMKDQKAFATDQDREVRAQTLDLRIFVDNGKPGRQGEITKRLHRGAPLDIQLSSAIAAAQQTDHQRWTLPTEIPSSLPERKSFDPSMVEDLKGTLDRVTEQVTAQAMKQRSTPFHSSELFLSVHERELHLSSGLTHRSKNTRAYLEAAFSFSDGKRADEYLSTTWSVDADGLGIEQLFDECSERAKLTLDTEKPLAGDYWVLLDSDVLTSIFSQTLPQLSGRMEYLSLPHKKKGDSFIPDARGDLLTIRLDPTLDYAAGTTTLSDEGLLQRPMDLVKNNQVVETSLDHQHASHLGRYATTSNGTWVIETGSKSRDELIASQDQVLEILQFSGLFVDLNTATFSSEIRLATLHDRKTGKKRTIKGGSMSGSLFENFKEAYLSNQAVKKMFVDYGSAHGYYGPDYALISQVSVAS